MELKILRILEILFFVFGLFLSLILVFVLGRGDASLGIYMFVIALYMIVGFLPYIAISFILLRFRINARARGEIIQGDHISWWLFRVSVWVVILGLFTTFMFSVTWGTKLFGVQVGTAPYYSNIENLRLIPPKGWSINENKSETFLPGGYTNPIFVSQKNGSPCTIALAPKVSIDTLEPRKQTSFADRVFSDYDQYDSNWYVASTSDAAGIKFSQHDRQYLPGEYRTSYSHFGTFLLFMSNGESVPDYCNSDFNALLKTAEPYFERVLLTSFSKGTLTVENVAGREINNNSYNHLVFTDENSGERHEVMRLSNGVRTGKFFIKGTEMYFAHPSTGLYKTNPFTAILTPISGATQTGQYISSLYVLEDKAYYLVGTSSLATCLDMYRPCAADLYSIPLVGGAPTFLAHSSLGGEILGYFPQEDAVYIRQRWGDAGCISILINKIVGGKEDSIKKFGDCYGAGEAEVAAYKEMIQAVNLLEAKVTGSKVSVRTIRVNNGTLEPLPTGDGYAIFSFEK
jgi:hypothetical protein